MSVEEFPPSSSSSVKHEMLDQEFRNTAENNSKLGKKLHPLVADLNAIL